MSPETSHAVTFSGSNGLLFSEGDEVILKWSPEILIPSRLENNITIDVSTQLQFNVFNSDNFRFNEVNIYRSNMNDGFLKVQFRSRPNLRCPATTRQFLEVCPIVFQVSVSPGQYLPSSVSIWSGVAFYKPKDLDDSKILMDCDVWKDSVAESGDMSLFRELPACPPTVPLAVFDVNYRRESMVSSMTSDTSYHQMFMEYFHPNITACYRQSM